MGGLAVPKHVHFDLHISEACNGCCTGNSTDRKKVLYEEREGDGYHLKPAKIGKARLNDQTAKDTAFIAFEGFAEKYGRKITKLAMVDQEMSLEKVDKKHWLKVKDLDKLEDTIENIRGRAPGAWQLYQRVDTLSKSEKKALKKSGFTNSDIRQLVQGKNNRDKLYIHEFLKLVKAAGRCRMWSPDLITDDNLSTYIRPDALSTLYDGGAEAGNDDFGVSALITAAFGVAGNIDW